MKKEDNWGAKTGNEHRAIGGWLSCKTEVLWLGPGFQCKVHIFLVDHTQCSLKI
jgi:hypothetical protein